MASKYTYSRIVEIVCSWCILIWSLIAYIAWSEQAREKEQPVTLVCTRNDWMPNV
jgi:hypothetical protein